MSKNKELQKAVRTLLNYCEEHELCKDDECIFYKSGHECMINDPGDWAVIRFLNEEFEE